MPIIRLSGVVVHGLVIFSQGINKVTSAYAMQAKLLLWLLIPSALPVMLSLPMLFLLANILMDKASLLGVLPPPLGPAVSDAIVGAVVGLAVALCSSAIIPWIGTVLSRRHIKVSSWRSIPRAALVRTC